MRLFINNYNREPNGLFWTIVFVVIMGLLAAIGCTNSKTAAIHSLGGVDTTERAYKPEDGAVCIITIDTKHRCAIIANATDGDLEMLRPGDTITVYRHEDSEWAFLNDVSGMEHLYYHSEIPDSTIYYETGVIRQIIK